MIVCKVHYYGNCAYFSCVVIHGPDLGHLYARFLGAYAVFRYKTKMRQIWAMKRKMLQFTAASLHVSAVSYVAVNSNKKGK